MVPGLGKLRRALALPMATPAMMAGGVVAATTAELDNLRRSSNLGAGLPAHHEEQELRRCATRGVARDRSNLRGSLLRATAMKMMMTDVARVPKFLLQFLLPLQSLQTMMEAGYAPNHLRWASEDLPLS
jgi:hypothetical protein